MIQYKCDACGAENIECKDINILEMPRQLRYYATSALGVKLVSFDKCGTAETHLCKECYVKLSYMFPIVECDE